MANGVSNLMWEDDVPPRGGYRSDREENVSHHAVATAARKNPGKWAKVKRFATSQRASSFAYQARVGRISAYREGFEVLARRDDEGYWVWVRYIGEEKKDE